jgi:hypothetical protein
MSYELKFLGEIRFGPTFYQLYINGSVVRDFSCGDTFAELCGGRYLAIQEWVTSDPVKGPITRVAIFDLKKEMVAKLKIVESGFATRFKLEDNIFTYSESRYLNQYVDVCVEWGSIDTWQPIIVESIFYRMNNAFKKYIHKVFKIYT